MNHFNKWHTHIKFITKKTSAGLKVLKCISPFIPFDTRMNMSSALLMLNFNNNYWSMVWGNTDRGLADQNQKLQNVQGCQNPWSLFRITIEVCSNVLFHELGWERLELSRSKQLTVCMYKVRNNNFHIRTAANLYQHNK